MFHIQRMKHQRTEHTTLASQSNKLYILKGADAETPQWKKEQMFVQMCEGLRI